MTDTVYPNPSNVGNASIIGKPDFYSAIPRAVHDMRAQRILTDRDVTVLALLLDFKGYGTSKVWPRQQTLAAAIDCSVDTIQRSIARLVKAGLVVKTRLKDALGRMGRCVYDLANTLFLLPAQAAKLRHGEWGRPSVKENKSMPQKCGLSEADLDVVQADNTDPDNTDPDNTDPDNTDPDNSEASPLVPIVVAVVVSSPAAKVKEEKEEQPSETEKQLMAAGVFGRVARTLAKTHGESRIQEVLKALKARPKVRDKAAWLVQGLQEGWNVNPCVLPADPLDLPHSHRLYAPQEPPSPCGRSSLRVLPPKREEEEGKCIGSDPSPGSPPHPPAAGGSRGTSGVGSSPVGSSPVGSSPVGSESLAAIDPLDALPSSQLAALEERARAALILESTGPVLVLLRQGRERRLVRARMRKMAEGLP